MKELKNNVEVSTLCSQTDEPTSIIRNGHGVLVIISMEGDEKLHSDLWKGGN